MRDEHVVVRMIIDIDRQVVVIGKKETQLTEQQVQVLAKLAQSKDFTSKQELQQFLGAKNPAVAQVVISRLKKRMCGAKVLAVSRRGYRIDHAYEPEIIGEVKEMQAATVLDRPVETTRYKGESLRLTHQEDGIIQRWAAACSKANNDCRTCPDEVICQKVADKLVGRVLP